jgi:GH15 family glucan-1,4-alpha-glucosidase
LVDTPRLDHAAIGNGRALALVGPDSAIDWCCLPRFDSPSVFGRILDDEAGGEFAFLHATGRVQGVTSYVRNTNVARTVARVGDEAWEVLDYAPWVATGFDHRAPLEIVRIVRPLAGQPRLRVHYDPRPNYGAEPPRLSITGAGIEARGTRGPLMLYSDLPPALILEGAEFVLRGPITFSLTWGVPPLLPTREAALRDLDDTIRSWRQWATSCALPTFAAEAVLRSALCLKLHVSADTGAIIAAATTSIPEAMGTARTWDYRYCWLRDAAFVVEALRRVGHAREGERFVTFLRDVVASGPLQPVYGVGGERELRERFLPHLRGFGGNGHVRVGNAAAVQQQHDLMGELVLCLGTLVDDPRLVHEDLDGHLELVARFVEMAIALAPTPDMGIWEFRTMLRPYTFSRAMCWAAMHRGAAIARRLGRPDLADRWERVATGEHEVILARAYNPALGMFTQSLDGEHADASNLLLPSLGFIDARDPRFVATMTAYETHLMRDGLMLRYANVDDLGDTTSAFTICTFWWIEALALMGDLDRAAREFERLMAYANPVGLFSEDIDPTTGRLLGNFPQAYTHVGLIHAAVTIGELLEARDGRVRAWV